MDAFVANSPMNRAMADGHRKRKGHELAGYWERVETRGGIPSVRLVRTCCPVDKYGN